MIGRAAVLDDCLRVNHLASCLLIGSNISDLALIGRKKGNLVTTEKWEMER